MDFERRAICLIGLAFAACGAAAQGYPTRPVSLIVPQTPGGTNDAVARLLAQKLSDRLGQPFIVDNRAGANGNIGTAVAAKSPKDGYTLLVTVSSAQAINPALYKNTGFDPVKDFEPIALLGVVPNVLVVNTHFPAKNLKEFLADSKSHQPPYQYGSAGNGSLNHLLGVMLVKSAGVTLEHVPYKGVAPALTDVIGGQIPMAFASLPSCISFIKSGRLRAIGVSSAKRSPALPDVPAIGEQVPGYAGDLWVGLFAIAGTPKPVVERLATEAAAITSSQDFVDKLAGIGAEPLRGGPTQLSARLRDDMARWAPIVKASGASVD